MVRDLAVHQLGSSVCGSIFRSYSEYLHDLLQATPAHILDRATLLEPYHGWSLDAAMETEVTPDFAVILGRANSSAYIMGNMIARSMQTYALQSGDVMHNMQNWYPVIDESLAQLQQGFVVHGQEQGEMHYE